MSDRFKLESTCVTYFRCSYNVEVLALSLEEGQLMVKLMLRLVKQGAFWPVSLVIFGFW